MNFFSKVGETLSETGRDVTNKAREITEVTRLHIDIRGKEDFIRKQYEEIGRRYYELHKNDEDPPMEEITIIKNALEQINHLQTQISKAKGQKICLSCGDIMDLSAKFCKKCGNKWEEIYEEENPD